MDQAFETGKHATCSHSEDLSVSVTKAAFVAVEEFKLDYSTMQRRPYYLRYIHIGIVYLQDSKQSGAHKHKKDPPFMETALSKFPSSNTAAFGRRL